MRPAFLPAALRAGPLRRLGTGLVLAGAAWAAVPAQAAPDLSTPDLSTVDVDVPDKLAVPATLACDLQPRFGPSTRLWIPVDAEALARQRGGFTGPDGLVVAIGIDRLVSINGELVSRTNFQIADVSQISVAEAQQARAALSSVKLIQNGTANIDLATLSSRTMGGTIIQNTLDDQRISSQTVISTTVNSLGLLKALNFQGTLNTAIANAVGQR